MTWFEAFAIAVGAVVLLGLVVWGILAVANLVGDTAMLVGAGVGFVILIAALLRSLAGPPWTHS